MALLLALFGAGVGVAFLVFGDDDGSEAAVTTTTSQAPLSRPTVPPLPDGAGFGEVLAILTFNTTATPSQQERIERAWRANGMLQGVFTASAEEIEDFAGSGLGADTLGAWGEAEDRDRIQTFICRFADDPGVSIVGTENAPC